MKRILSWIVKGVLLAGLLVFILLLAGNERLEQLMARADPGHAAFIPCHTWRFPSLPTTRFTVRPKARTAHTTVFRSAGYNRAGKIIS